MDTQKNKKFILAFGEATGHKHVIEGDIGPINMNQGVLREFENRTDSTITHEEHQTRILPPGLYVNSTIKEYDYDKQKSRKVID